nr:hypothetical protein [Immundisolibacter cernigliae]
MDLGQFLGQRHRAIAEYGSHVIQQGQQAMRRFIKDERARFLHERRQRRLPGRRARRQKAFEGEAHRRQAAGTERRHGGAGSGQRHHTDARRMRRGHQTLAGVADGRRAGIADQSHVFALSQTLDQAAGLRRLVVLVQRQQRRADAVMIQQRPAVAGVLGSNDRHRRQGLRRARAQIGQISERCGHHVQSAATCPGFHCLCPGAGRPVP